MTFTVICLVAMLLLWKYQADIDSKWWLALAILLTVAVLLGIEIGMLRLAVAVGLWKVIKDICSQR